LVICGTWDWNTAPATPLKEAPQALVVDARTFFVKRL
jgi:hypothetical protein